MTATCPSYATFGQDLVKKLLKSDLIFTWNGFTRQGDEAGKLAIFFLCLCTYKSNAAKMMQKEIFHFMSVFWVHLYITEMIGFTPRVFYERFCN